MHILDDVPFFLFIFASTLQSRRDLCECLGSRYISWTAARTRGAVHVYVGPATSAAR